MQPPQAHLAGVWPRPIWRPQSREGALKEVEGNSSCGWWELMTTAHQFHPLWPCVGLSTVPVLICDWDSLCQGNVQPPVPSTDPCVSMCVCVPAHVCGCSAQELHAQMLHVCTHLHTPVHACTWLCSHKHTAAGCLLGMVAMHTCMPQHICEHQIAPALAHKCGSRRGVLEPPLPPWHRLGTQAPSTPCRAPIPTTATTMWSGIQPCTMRPERVNE